MQRRWLATVCLFVLLTSTALADEPASPTKENATPSREELEKKFAEELSGATLVGHYTTGDSPSNKEDRYTLTEVSKLRDDYWTFQTRIVYGEHDLTVPLTLEVKWAGDTPVITLTETTIPGLGTFSSRVLVYRGQYAGTWSAGDHGGLLFGRVEKAKDAAAKKTTAKP